MPKKTVVVEAKLGEGFAMESQIGNHVLRVDQPEAMGGTGTGPNPLQYFLLSLGGCIGAIARIVASQKNLPFRSVALKMQGELDTDVLLGMSRDKRAGFTAIEVYADIDADMSLEEKEAFLVEIDARCPVSDNTSSVTPISLHLQKK